MLTYTLGMTNIPAQRTWPLSRPFTAEHIATWDDAFLSGFLKSASTTHGDLNGSDYRLVMAEAAERLAR